MLVSIFIPTYNEEKILRSNIIKVYQTAKSLPYKFEIVICDDTSSDSSGRIAKELCKKYREIRYLRFDNGPSRRENLAEAFKSAKGDVVLFSDTDLAADISALKKLISAIEKGNDVAIGARYMKNTQTIRKPERRVISFFYNLFIKLYFGSRFEDHNCGFKAFKKRIIIELVKEAGYDHRFVRGWFWDAEILIRAQERGYKIAEVPVRWKEGEKSTFSLARELRMLPYIIGLRDRLNR
jgi:glycosyltransferase involved in cell wall biosynthesis